MEPSSGKALDLAPFGSVPVSNSEPRRDSSVRVRVRVRAGNQAEARLHVLLHVLVHTYLPFVVSQTVLSGFTCADKSVLSAPALPWRLHLLRGVPFFLLSCLHFRQI